MILFYKAGHRFDGVKMIVTLRGWITIREVNKMEFRHCNCIVVFNKDKENFFSVRNMHGRLL